MKKHHLLICDPFSIESLALLKSHPLFEVSVVEKYSRPTDSDLSLAEGIIIRSGTHIDSDFLSKSPHLKVIVTATSGFDHINFDACKEKGISVMHTPNAAIDSVTELTFALMLAATRHLYSSHKNVKKGDWKTGIPYTKTLSGKTLGLVGLGRIGSRVAEVAHSFKMKVLAFDPFIDEVQFNKAQAIRTSYEELLLSSDIVSFHVPYTKETHHMINSITIQNIPEHVIFINTSRGSVLCEDTIIKALQTKTLAGLGLDVFEREPLPRNSRFLQFENVFLSPHIGAYTEESFQSASHEAAQKIIQFFTQKTLSDALPPEAPWYQESFFHRK